MDEGLPWYRRRPRAFIDGAQGMGPELIGAYSMLLDLIYARGGYSDRDDRHLAGVLGCSTRKARSLTDGLISRGKIVETDGGLTNLEALKELKISQESHEASVEHGRAGAAKRWRNEAETVPKRSRTSDEPVTNRSRTDSENNAKSNKIKDLPIATPLGAEIADKIRLDKKEDDDPRAGARDHPDDIPFDQVDQDQEFLHQIAQASGVKVEKEADALGVIHGWKTLDLTEKQILSVIKAVMKRKNGGPPKRLAYFTEALQLEADEIKRPKLAAVNGGKTDDKPKDRRTPRQREADRRLAHDLDVAARLDREG